MWRLVKTALCLGLLWTYAGTASAENKLAFVIGINSYPNLASEAQLQRAVNDAEAVGDTLQSLGFTVTRVTKDATLNNVLSRFSAFISTVSPGDTVALFYAGHGVSLDDGTYLLPSDIPALSPIDESLAKHAAIAEKEFAFQIRQAGARVALVVIDACRDNPFPKRGTRAIGSSTRGLGRLMPAEGTFTLYSAREGQTALDRLSGNDPSRNSVFTRVFVEELKKPGVSLSEMGEAVRDDVAALARTEQHDQVPAVYNDLIGARSIYLAGRTPTVLPPTPAPVDGERSDFDMAKQIGTISAWDVFLAHHADGFLADVAKGERQKLISAPPPVNAPSAAPKPSALLTPPNSGAGQADQGSVQTPTAPKPPIGVSPSVTPQQAPSVSHPAHTSQVNIAPKPKPVQAVKPKSSSCFMFNGERVCE